MGIASLILAISAVCSLSLLIVVVITAHESFHLHKIEGTPYSYMLGWWIFLTGLLCVCGIVFGIGGLRQQNRRHSLAIFGLCANIALPLGFMFFLVIGASAYDPATGDFNSSPFSKDSASSSIVAVCVGLGITLAFFLFSRIVKRRSAPPGSHQSILAGDQTACTTCGKNVPTGSLFCRRCGTAFFNAQHAGPAAL